MIEHDGCKGCRYEKEPADSKHCIGCLQNATDKYVKMTNYDRIKNMSVEEIADMLEDSSFVFNCTKCESNPKQGSCEKNNLHATYNCLA